MAHKEYNAYMCNKEKGPLEIFPVPFYLPCRTCLRSSICKKPQQLYKSYVPVLREFVKVAVRLELGLRIECPMFIGEEDEI